MTIENEQFQKLFKTLQGTKNAGGIMITDLSALLDISIDDIEEHYWTGRLGTAGTLLKFECQQCKVELNEMNRRGRYCMNCSDEISAKAGVQVKSLQQIERTEEKEAARQRDIQQLEMARKAKMPTAEKARGSSGFIRNWKGSC